MKKSVLLFIAVYCFSCGSTKEFSQDTQDKEKSSNLIQWQYGDSPDLINKIRIAQSAVVTTQNRQTQVINIGSGLRKVTRYGVVTVKVYVAQLFVSEPELFKRTETEALSSLDSMQTVVISMTFTRDVDVEKLTNAWEAGFIANDVDRSKPEIQSFLDAVKTGGSVKETKSLVIVGEKLPDGQETIIYENISGDTQTISGQTGFIRDIFSAWLGQSSDSRLEDLKTQLLK